jgi:UDP-N-acetyl-D-galactosamine dehydrogenase
MGAYIAQQTVKNIIQAGGAVKGSQVLVLGLTFKENCPDLRNSKVADVVRELTEFGCQVTVHDPLADPIQAKQEYGITLTPWGQIPRQADALLVAVAHQAYQSMGVGNLLTHLKPGGVFLDVKSAFDPNAITATGHRLWRL